MLDHHGHQSQALALAFLFEMTRPFNSTAPTQSTSWRRHSDPPALWASVLAGSFVLHLLVILLVRVFEIQVSPFAQNETASTPIELIEVAPQETLQETVGDESVEEAPTATASSTAPANLPPATPTEPVVEEPPNLTTPDVPLEEAPPPTPSSVVSPQIPRTTTPRFTLPTQPRQQPVSPSAPQPTSPEPPQQPALPTNPIPQATQPPPQVPEDALESAPPAPRPAAVDEPEPDEPEPDVQEQEPPLAPPSAQNDLEPPAPSEQQGSSGILVGFLGSSLPERDARPGLQPSEPAQTKSEYSDLLPPLFGQVANLELRVELVVDGDGTLIEAVVLNKNELPPNVDYDSLANSIFRDWQYQPASDNQPYSLLVSISIQPLL